MSPRRSFAISRNELRILRRDPTPLAVLIAMPLLMMPILQSTFRATLLVSGHNDASGAEFAVPGQAVQFLFFLPPYIGFAFFREHAWNTWPRVRASSATSAELLVAKSLPMLGVGALQVAVVFGVGAVFLDLHVGAVLPAVVFVSIAAVLCAVALGIALTAVTRTFQQLNAVGFLGGTLCSAIGGAFVPLAGLPGWARTISPITPHYWAMRGYRAILLDGAGTGAVLLPVLVLLIYTGAFSIVALARFRFDDTKTGTGWA
jgi:ABC-2 type transport system permease protein